MLPKKTEDGSGDESCPDTKHSRISHSIVIYCYMWLFQRMEKSFLLRQLLGVVIVKIKKANRPRFGDRDPDEMLRLSKQLKEMEQKAWQET